MLAVSGLPFLLDDLLAVAMAVDNLESRPLLGLGIGTGFSGLALAKAKILFKVTFDIFRCSRMALWRTLAFQSTITALLSL